MRCRRRVGAVSMTSRVFCILVLLAACTAALLLILSARFPAVRLPKLLGQQRPRHSQTEHQNQLPWYFSNGQRRPRPVSLDERTGMRQARLWPEEDPDEDRVESQLMFVPRQSSNTTNGRLKKILLFNNWLYDWKVRFIVEEGRHEFLSTSCPVDTCTITTRNQEAADADAVVFLEFLIRPPAIPRPQNQIWILHHLESPANTYRVSAKNVFNWTASYRRDSDIAIPYGRWAPYPVDHQTKRIENLTDYAANKTKKIAWFVSNCLRVKNARQLYAKKLAKYIQVDIYGSCGTLKCPKSSRQKCLDLLKTEYKFYLAFENSNCREYITEKFFVNALGHNVLPIVMGAPREDYAKVAPPHSFLHVDDFASPRKLAEYLHRLDQDDALYNSYFRWKGSGEFLGRSFLCRLCVMLHDHPDKQARHYQDINAWWRPPGICIQGSWRKR